MRSILMIYVQLFSLRASRLQNTTNKVVTDMKLTDMAFLLFLFNFFPPYFIIIIIVVKCGNFYSHWTLNTMKLVISRTIVSACNEQSSIQPFIIWFARRWHTLSHIQLSRNRCRKKNMVSHFKGILFRCAHWNSSGKKKMISDGLSSMVSNRFCEANIPD